MAMKTKRKKKQGKPDPAIVADLVKRIVAAARPEKIVLFGSAARGEMVPDSDYDLLVIKGGWRLSLQPPSENGLNGAAIGRLRLEPPSANGLSGAATGKSGRTAWCTSRIPTGYAKLTGAG